MTTMLHQLYLRHEAGRRNKKTPVYIVLTEKTGEDVENDGLYIYGIPVVIQEIKAVNVILYPSTIVSKQNDGLLYTGDEEFQIPYSEMERIGISISQSNLLIYHGGRVYRIKSYKPLDWERTNQVFVERTRQALPVLNSACGMESETPGDTPKNVDVNEPDNSHVKIGWNGVDTKWIELYKNVAQGVIFEDDFSSGDLLKWDIWADAYVIDKKLSLPSPSGDSNVGKYLGQEMTRLDFQYISADTGGIIIAVSEALEIQIALGIYDDLEWSFFDNFSGDLSKWLIYSSNPDSPVIEGGKLKLINFPLPDLYAENHVSKNNVAKIKFTANPKGGLDFGIHGKTINTDFIADLIVKPIEPDFTILKLYMGGDLENIEIMEITPGIEYEAKMIFNFSTKLISLYVNNILKRNDIPFYELYGGDTSEIGGIEIRPQTTYGCFVDDIYLGFNNPLFSLVTADLFTGYTPILLYTGPKGIISLRNFSSMWTKCDLYVDDVLVAANIWTKSPSYPPITEPPIGIFFEGIKNCWFDNIAAHGYITVNDPSFTLKFLDYVERCHEFSFDFRTMGAMNTGDIGVFSFMRDETSFLDITLRYDWGTSNYMLLIPGEDEIPIAFDQWHNFNIIFNNVQGTWTITIDNNQSLTFSGTLLKICTHFKVLQNSTQTEKLLIANMEVNSVAT